MQEDVSGKTGGTNRRDFLKMAGMGAAAVAGAGLLGGAPALAQFRPGGRNGRPGPPVPGLSTTDVAVLQFALNLEYLEAEFYSYAAFGTGIENFGIGVNGAGLPGTVTVKSRSSVPFATQLVRQLAIEIAVDERAHVAFIRGALLSNGVQPVARPPINLRESFTAAAVAAGIISTGQTFDPFADEVSFLAGSFIFEDVGVTAYKGAARLLDNKDVLEAAAGILGVEAYHAGAIRTLIAQAGGAPVSIAQKVSDLRDAVDGASDDDQGVTLGGQVNVVPTDNNGLAFSRSPRQVLNIVYLGGESSGGFFPAGLNGDLR